MNSIPLAMTWELIGRCRNAVILTFLCTNLFCSLLMSSLQSNGPVDLSDPSMMGFQLGMILFSIFGIGTAINSAYKETSRVYVLPIDTATFVTWRMIPAMAVMSLCVILNALLIDLMFGVSWPMLWPAMAAPVGLAMLQAALWSFEKTVLQILSVLVAGAIFGTWYAFRFQSIFLVQLHPLIFLLEATPLLLMAVISHRFAIFGFGRLRCGESVLTSRWDELLNAADKDIAFLKWGNSYPAPVFQSPASAQFWFESQKKEWAFPGIVIATLTIQILAWGAFERDLNKLAVHMLIGGVAVMVGAMLSGLIVGNFGRADSSVEMGQFLASRPMTDHDMARATLAVMVRANVTSWGIYLIFCVVISTVLFAMGNTRELLAGPLLQWWYFPAILLLAWTITGVFATLYMTGHETFLARIICGCIAVYLAVLSSALLLDVESKRQLFAITQMATGIVMLIVTAGVFCVSVQRRVVSAREGTIAGIVWTGLSSITVLEVLRNPGGSYALASLLVGVSSLVLFPFAAAPLALKWNRHR